MRWRCARLKRRYPPTSYSRRKPSLWEYDRLAAAGRPRACELTAGVNRGNLLSTPDDKAILAAVKKFAHAVTARMNALAASQRERLKKPEQHRPS